MAATITAPRFLYNTASMDGATLTTNSQISTLPVTNLQNEIVRRPWRTTGTTQMVWALYDVGSTITVNMAAIFGHNLTSVAAVTLQANSANNWGAPPFEVGLTLISDPDSVMYEKAVSFAQGTYRYWRLIMQGANNGTYWEIGRFVAGSYFAPTLPYDLPTPQRSDFDPSVMDEAEGQQVYSRQRDMFRVYRVNFTGLDRGDQETFLAMYRNRRMRKPFAAAFHPTDGHQYNRDTIYGVMTLPLSQQLVNLQYGDLAFEMKEVW